MAKIYHPICEYCGNQFEASRRHARFCCDSHRVMYNQGRRQKKKEGKKQSNITTCAWCGKIYRERFYKPHRCEPSKSIESVVNPFSPGYIYLLRSLDGYYKIGKTTKPEARIKLLSVKLPFPIEVECLIQTDDMNTLETWLHQRYSSKRVNGEWFLLDEDDVEYIKGLAR